LFQALHVVGDDQMIGAEHRAKLADALDRACYRLLVEVVAEDIDPVGAGQVVELIAVEIREHDARGGLHEGCGFEVLAHEPAVLERHPIGVGELQIGDAVGRLGGAADRFGKARIIERRQPLEAGAAARRDLLRRIVGAGKPALLLVVERHPRHDGSKKPGPVVTGTPAPARPPAAPSWHGRSASRAWPSKARAGGAMSPTTLPARQRQARRMPVSCWPIPSNHALPERSYGTM